MTYRDVVDLHGHITLARFAHAGYRPGAPVEVILTGSGSLIICHDTSQPIELVSPAKVRQDRFRRALTEARHDDQH